MRGHGTHVLVLTTLETLMERLRPAALAPFLALGAAALLVAVLLAGLSLLLATPASGAQGASLQRSASPPPAAWCDDLERARGTHCEVRALSLPVTGAPFAVEGLSNGGIRVEGWSGSEIRVTARVVARRASSAAAAQDLAASVRVRGEGGGLRVDGPRSGLFSRSSWSVDVRVQVPEGTPLALSTTNGAVHVEGVGGRVTAQSTNGALVLNDVVGSVDARTTNGSITLAYGASPAPGDRISIQATNGALELVLPGASGATLEARTSNGRITSDFPLEMTGRRQTEARGTLGSGGAAITLRTTNGPIRIRRAG